LRDGAAEGFSLEGLQGVRFFTQTIGDSPVGLCG